MNVADLASPGLIVGSMELRRLAARVISRAEIQDNADQQAALAAFFVACAAAVQGGAAATSVLVTNGQAVTVTDSAANTSPGTLVVSAGALAGVVLTTGTITPAA